MIWIIKIRKKIVLLFNFTLKETSNLEIIKNWKIIEMSFVAFFNGSKYVNGSKYSFLVVDFNSYKYDEKTLKNQILCAVSQCEIIKLQKLSVWKKQKKEKKGKKWQNGEKNVPVIVQK